MISPYLCKNNFRTKPSCYPIFGFYLLIFFKLEITNPNINRIKAQAFLAKILVLEELDNKKFDTKIFYFIIKKKEIQ
jgi:hypothetical protein